MEDEPRTKPARQGLNPPAKKKARKKGAAIPNAAYTM